MRLPPGLLVQDQHPRSDVPLVVPRPLVRHQPQDAVDGDAEARIRRDALTARQLKWTSMLWSVASPSWTVSVRQVRFQPVVVATLSR